MLKQIEDIYGIEWPANDESPKNVYAKFITPLHGEWNKMMQDKSIGGGEGMSAQLPFQTEKYIEVVQDAVRYKEEQGITENVKVCETGYNMGHSALTYLFGAEGLSEEIKVEYHGFSFPHDNHQMIAKEMKNIFGLTDRFDIFWGDSTKSLPYYIGNAEKNQELNQCDVIIVDGGHSVDVATKDIANFRSLANKEHHVLLVDDLECVAGWCFGPKQAWNASKAAGDVTEEACWASPVLWKGVVARGFCWGQYNF